MERDLNSVVEARLKAKLQKGLTSSKLAMERLIAEGKVSRDFIFEVGTTKKGIKTNIEFHPYNDQRNVGAWFSMPEQAEEFRINQHAVRQVAEKLQIPAAYLTSLLFGEEWQKTLGYQIMNTHNGWTDRNKVLVRAVGSEVRAFLSDQYRRLDSKLIFTSHIEEVFNNGGQLADGFMDETRVMVESLIPAPIPFETKLNGVVSLVFGSRLVTSDYGDGALDLRSFVLQGVCLNGMVRESVLRAVHLGAKLPDNLALSQHTFDLDSQTTASAIKDLTKNLFSANVIRARLEEIKAASEITVDPVKELKALFSSAKLLKGEADEIGKILMANNPNDGVQGEATLWKLTQGISAFANREDVTERRRMELEEIAGDVFNKISK